MDLVLRLIPIGPWFTTHYLFDIQKATVARAITETSFELVIGGEVKFKIVKLLTVARAKTKM